MLEDPGNYAAIGGDSYLSGFVKGFEVVPYPYLTEVKGLPEEVGNSYQGRVLFTEQEDGTYKANYKESLEILEYYFPKDKNIFLMCGGGGYAGMTKKLLVSLGWDKDKIYNTGGYWFYNGDNNIITKRGENEYDFWKVVYHDINFDTLTEVEE
jgi:rhodanese-related sulfurtransferase